jgi:hypothetical protein
MESAQIPAWQVHVSIVDLMLFVMFLTMWPSVRAQLDILVTQTILLWAASKWNVFQMMTAHLTDSVMVKATSA